MKRVLRYKIGQNKVPCGGTVSITVLYPSKPPLNFYPSHYPEAKVARVHFPKKRIVQGHLQVIESSGCAWDMNFNGY